MKRLVTIVALAFAAACSGGRLPCYGPSDCGGNACCYEQLYVQNSTNVFCSAAASACEPAVTIDRARTRLCQTDADCTAGGISTNSTLCCAASVESQSARSCTSSSRCFNPGTAPPDPAK